MRGARAYTARRCSGGLPNQSQSRCRLARPGRRAGRARTSATPIARTAVDRRHGRAPSPGVATRRSSARAGHRRSSRRRGHRAARAGGARHGRRGRLSLALARRGRPEPDRPRAGRGARSHPHAGADGGARRRRRPSVLHAGLRLRLHAVARRDAREVAEGGDPRGHRARRAPVQASGHRLDLPDHGGCGARPAPGGRRGRARSVRGLGRRRAFRTGGRPAAVERVGALSIDLLSSDCREPDARHRHARPGQRQDLLSARDGVAQHAPLAGHGRAAGHRPARDPRRLGRRRSPRPAGGSGRAGESARRPRFQRQSVPGAGAGNAGRHRVER